jgi:membrane protein YdbS with pleckstrin-like domain
MLPAITLAAVVSLLVWTGRWYLDDLSAFADTVGDWAIFLLAWAVWPALTVAFLYRTVLYTYRLTDGAVLAEFGFFSRPIAPVPLKHVTAVVVGGGWLLRQLGVGWVEVRTADRAVRLRGVRNPSHFAEQIRTARAASQSASV